MQQSTDKFTSIIASLRTPNVNKKVIYMERGEFLRKVLSDFADSTNERYNEQISKAATDKEKEELRTKLIRPKIISETDKILEINGNIGINTMFDLISQNSIYYSIDEFVVCKNCKIVDSKNKLRRLPVDAISSNVETFPVFIKPFESMSKKNCMNCESKLTKVKNPKRIVLVDCEAFRIKPSKLDRYSLNIFRKRPPSAI